jgi:TATA-box binding protein (TBP) (component of TFIID and TFIIIB)
METNNQQKTEEPTLAFLVQNVVSTYNSGVQRLGLRRVCMDCPWSSLNDEVFAALIDRIEDPKTTSLKFTSGNNVCTGAKKVSPFGSVLFTNTLQRLFIRE